MGGKTTTGKSLWEQVKGYFGGESTTTSTTPSVPSEMAKGAAALRPSKLRERANQGLDFDEYPKKKR